MDDQELLQMMVAEPWDTYRCAGWKGRLDLLRHTISVYIAYADRTYEDLCFVLDGHTELRYMVNKAAAVSDDYTMRGFVRFVFALKEGETKMFTWVTAHGKREWILSRDSTVLYAEIPEFREGFFIRYGTFRDECFAACEKAYGWGYKSDIQRIEVPERDLESLTWLEPEDEFELVRYLDDGRSFETTDTDRLLRFVDEHRAQEEILENPDPDRVQRFNDLYQAIKHYAAEQKPMRRARKVFPMIGKSFSWMKDNWEECDFRYNVSMDPNDWQDAVYRRYGDLPDGRHFGVYIWPKSEAWPQESAMMIVGKDRKMLVTFGIDNRDVPKRELWPQAAASSPSGNSIVWLKDGEIWAWQKDVKEKRFLSDGGDRLTSRLENVLVRDAIMRTDGILLMFLEDGRTMGYLCDADMVLFRWDDGWLPKTEEHRNLSWAIKQGMLDACPEELFVMVHESDSWGEYDGCGVKRVFFHPGVERIEGEILADNPGLEKIVIPAYVEYVEWGAFYNCVNLRELVINGDPARVANWDPEAFKGCPCEEEYLRLRSGGR